MRTEPIIVTLKIDERSSEFFNDLRRRYFPASINYIDAHLTLFHQLPSSGSAQIEGDIAEIALATTKFPLLVSEVKMIGKGVAYQIESELLVQIRQRLAQGWQNWLTAQDQQKLWPHITVQNKVSPQEAEQLHKDLADRFTPFNVHAEGLNLWYYQNGPWEFIKSFHFLT